MIRAVAFAARSSRPSATTLIVTVPTRNTSSNACTSLVHRSMNRLTKPSNHTVRGMAGRTVVLRFADIASARLAKDDNEYGAEPNCLDLPMYSDCPHAGATSSAWCIAHPVGRTRANSSDRRMSVSMGLLAPDEMGDRLGSYATACEVFVKTSSVWRHAVLIRGREREP